MMRGGAGNAVSSVLVVEPDQGVRHRMQSVLAPFHNIFTCGNADDALKLLDRNRFTAAVISAGTPPLGGVALMGTMPRFHDGGLLPVLLVCDTIDKSYLADARQAGVDDVLVRPFTEDLLHAKVSSLVSHAIEMSWEKLDKGPREVLKQTASAFKDATLGQDNGEPLNYGSFRESCEPLIKAVNDQDIKGILNGVKGHDDYTYVHSLRASTFLSFFGHAIGIRGDDLHTLAIGGLMHDIGKIDTPLTILNKPARLNDGEWSVMRNHVDKTVEMLDAADGVPQGVKIIAAQHHERLDGTGYPNNLKGKDLNELARMAAIVDVFGALTDRRPYKRAMAREQAFETMGDMSSHLDQNLVRIYRELLNDTCAAAA